jgi:hypothetical protein
MHILFSLLPKIPVSWQGAGANLSHACPELSSSTQSGVVDRQNERDAHCKKRVNPNLRISLV